MRKSNLRCLALPIGGILLLSSCSKINTKEHCIKVARASIISVHSRDTAAVHVPLSIPITFTCATNLGGNFNSFNPASSTTSGKVEVMANYDVCDPGIAGMGVLLTQHYFFQAESPGIYHLDFLQPDSSVLTDTILVR
jgi:hypothetical protein